MLSNFYSASRSSIEDVTSQPEPPPPYVEGNRDEKSTVEVCEPPPNAEFEPVERQRHFGILRYTVNNRFKKLILIGIANFVLFILFGVVVIIILVTLKTNKASTVTTTATTRIAGLVTTAATTTATSSTKMTTVTQPSTKLITVPPQSTTTRISTATSVKPIEPDSCTPVDSTTFLFAYSNDFDPRVILRAFNYFTSEGLISPHYTTFASIRFDTTIEGVFEYQNTFGELASYVQYHLPDPSLGFGRYNTGSNVLRMIDRFLDNTLVPVCGSKMIIYVKRYPNDTDYSRIVAKMRQHHSYFTIFASTNSSGGNHAEILYDLASKTNGLCAFDDDDNIFSAEDSVLTVFIPYLVYAANPQVSGNGRIQLPPLLVQDDSGYWFTMTMQDNGSMTVVQAVMLSWINDNGSGQLGKNGTKLSGYGTGNHIGYWERLDTISYKIHLDYDYTDSKERRVQIRVNGEHPIDYWVPYDN